MYEDGETEGQTGERLGAGVTEGDAGKVGYKGKTKGATKETCRQLGRQIERQSEKTYGDTLDSRSASLWQVLYPHLLCPLSNNGYQMERKMLLCEWL